MKLLAPDDTLDDLAANDETSFWRVNRHESHAMPPAILMAVIAPTILTTGMAETIAAAITATAAFMRLPFIMTILIGVMSVVLLRMLLS